MNTNSIKEFPFSLYSESFYFCYNNWLSRQFNIPALSSVVSAWSAGVIEYTDCISVEGKTPTNECPGYGINSSDGKASILELWGMWSTLQIHSDPER